MRKMSRIARKDNVATMMKAEKYSRIEFQQVRGKDYFNKTMALCNFQLLKIKILQKA